MEDFVEGQMVDWHVLQIIPSLNNVNTNIVYKLSLSTRLIALERGYKEPDNMCMYDN